MDTEVTTGVVTDNDAEVLWFFGELLIVRMPGDRTGERLALVEHQGRRGQAPPWHRHLYDDETFVVLEGEVAVWRGDPTRPVVRARCGDTVFLPRQVPHAFRIDSETARFLSGHTPAGHERFFREGGEPGPTRTLPPEQPPDMGKALAAAENHGIELLGPPPSLNHDRIL